MKIRKNNKKTGILFVFLISKISCVLPRPKGRGLFEIFEPEKKTSRSDVSCLNARVYFFSVLILLSMFSILADSVHYCSADSRQECNFAKDGCGGWHDCSDTMTDNLCDCPTLYKCENGVIYKKEYYCQNKYFGYEDTSKINYEEYYKENTCVAGKEEIYKVCSECQTCYDTCYSRNLENSEEWTTEEPNCKSVEPGSSCEGPVEESCDTCPGELYDWVCISESNENAGLEESYELRSINPFTRFIEFFKNIFSKITGKAIQPSGTSDSQEELQCVKRVKGPFLPSCKINIEFDEDALNEALCKDLEQHIDILESELDISIPRVFDLYRNPDPFSEYYEGRPAFINDGVAREWMEVIKESMKYKKLCKPDNTAYAVPVYRREINALTLMYLSYNSDNERRLRDIDTYYDSLKLNVMLRFEDYDYDEDYLIIERLMNIMESLANDFPDKEADFLATKSYVNLKKISVYLDYRKNHEVPNFNDLKTSPDKALQFIKRAYDIDNNFKQKCINMKNQIYSVMYNKLVNQIKVERHQFEIQFPENFNHFLELNDVKPNYLDNDYWGRRAYIMLSLKYHAVNSKEMREASSELFCCYNKQKYASLSIPRLALMYQYALGIETTTLILNSEKSCRGDVNFCQLTSAAERIKMIAKATETETGLSSDCLKLGTFINRDYAKFKEAKSKMSNKCRSIIERDCATRLTCEFSDVKKVMSFGEPLSEPFKFLPIYDSAGNDLVPYSPVPSLEYPYTAFSKEDREIIIGGMEGNNIAGWTMTAVDTAMWATIIYSIPATAVKSGIKAAILHSVKTGISIATIGALHEQLRYEFSKVSPEAGEFTADAMATGLFAALGLKQVKNLLSSSGRTYNDGKIFEITDSGTGRRSTFQVFETAESRSNYVGYLRNSYGQSSNMQIGLDPNKKITFTQYGETQKIPTKLGFEVPKSAKPRTNYYSEFSKQFERAQIKAGNAKDVKARLASEGKCPSRCESLSENRVVDQNLGLMNSNVRGGMQGLLMRESAGTSGSAGSWRRLPCNAANFVYDAQGKIIIFDNLQRFSPEIRAGIDSGIYREGTFRIALNMGAGKSRIVNILDVRGDIALRNIQTAVNKWNCKNAFPITETKNLFVGEFVEASIGGRKVRGYITEVYPEKVRIEYSDRALFEKGERVSVPRSGGYFSEGIVDSVSGDYVIVKVSGGSKSVHKSAVKKKGCKHAYAYENDVESFF